MRGCLPEGDRDRPNEPILDQHVKTWDVDEDIAEDHALLLDMAKTACEENDCNCLVVDPRYSRPFYHAKKGFKLAGATFDENADHDFYFIAERV